ncbi:MAG: hypothetical protein RL630_1800 [Verrucomicrobiota bacterium]|jgi:hypothetical protein
MGCHYFSDGFSTKWSLESEGLIKDTTQGIKIRAPIERVAAELLGRHHKNRTNDRTGLVHRLKGGFCHCSGLAEIEQLDAIAAGGLRLQHDVSGFDVPVDDILFVSGSQTEQALCGKLTKGLFGHGLG